MSEKVCLDTNHGKIIIELDTEKAPITTENFLNYVKDEFYNATIFHRVIPGFMIQGGGFLEGMIQKSTNDPVKNEADNGLPNKRGTIAMARTPDPDSASSQFFINLKDNDFLNYTAPTSQGWGYCVFGEVTEGMDIVDSIAQVATGSSMGHGDVPVETVVINSASIV
ncbi:MAG: peptidylprolyl isomerase [Gammaproteobacteria bacterium]|nr:peptidylprolyl isomerase [Gammaproteobacteria bacterium]